MVESGLHQIVLASASPRRRQLLEQLGISYLTYPVDIDESVIPGESPVDHVLRLALEKAYAARKTRPNQSVELPVLGSDTVIEIEGDILGKPADAGQASEMLARLSGWSHRVHTGVAIVCAEKELTAISSSVVEFAVLDNDQIQKYIDSGEPFDKAGAYAIQGIAGQFIRSIKGSYSGIMGLPLFETASLLADCGIATLGIQKPER